MKIVKNAHDFRSYFHIRFIDQRIIILDNHPATRYEEIVKKFYYLIFAKMGIPVIIITERADLFKNIYGKNTFGYMSFSQFDELIENLDHGEKISDLIQDYYENSIFYFENDVLEILSDKVQNYMHTITHKLRKKIS